MNARTSLRLVMAAGLLAALAVGCGDDDGQAVSSGGAGGDDGPVLVVENVGGFLPAELSYQSLPTVVAYADGRVIEAAPQILIYPGPALPALQQREVTVEVLVAIEDAARQAGLDVHDVDYGDPPVADAGDTVVTVVIDGESYVHRATALGLPDNPGLSGDQESARTALEGFLSAVADLEALGADGAVSDAEPFDADRYRLWARPADDVGDGSTTAAGSDGDEGASRTASGIAPAPGEPEPTVVAWNVASVELTESTCIPVEGDAVAGLTELLGEANQLTRFDDGNQVWTVVARPVLPHEPTCPEG